ncbi:hypothetical protein [Nesterenkonia sp. HG001]|uniref:hypothetical protein n=1 Tax=Nesterenkonia sp. HG001 TaxID=2983207 RepID=UPI002AC648B5|nr:hypothetical protein [Nesterenkonia sp. HG001]MDZ5076982.1 hypothetical protein [Nesterenkonia sp. HG001]
MPSTTPNIGLEEARAAILREIQGLRQEASSLGEQDLVESVLARTDAMKLVVHGLDSGIRQELQGALGEVIDGVVTAPINEVRTGTAEALTQATASLRKEIRAQTANVRKDMADVRAVQSRTRETVQMLAGADARVGSSPASIDAVKRALFERLLLEDDRNPKHSPNPEEVAP